MPKKNIAANRAALSHRLRYAVRHPGRIPAHLARAGRDAWLRFRAPDHVTYYRAVMKSDTAKNPEGAVGSKSHERWLALGAMQFDYLRAHGLEPQHRMLEIGCGNLRAGWRFIEYLDSGNYYGIDISPDILMAAQHVLAERDLQDKLPVLTPVRDLAFAFLPDAHFDVVHAHSVFSHSPLSVIDECLAHVGRVLAPGGWFDFTFDRTEGKEHHVLREDFYYRTETLVALAEKHGLSARFMDDWEKLPHGQSKLRVTHAPAPAPAAGGRAGHDPAGSATAGAGMASTAEMTDTANKADTADAVRAVEPTAAGAAGPAGSAAGASGTSGAADRTRTAGSAHSTDSARPAHPIGPADPVDPVDPADPVGPADTAGTAGTATP